MTIPFLYDVILYCLFKINGERTIFSVYHLLNGKKSSQTIQDAHLFQVGRFFKTYNDLSRHQFEEIISDLERMNFVQKSGDQQYKLDNIGYLRAEGFIRQYPFLNYLNGWKFQSAEVFWKRLSLLVQVISNLNQNEASYVPIQKNGDVQAWLKGFLNNISYGRQELGIELHNELSACFENNKYVDPSIAVIRFTGFHAIGMTEKQAGEVLQMEATLYHYQFVSLIHYMINTVETNRKEYPLLNAVLANIQTAVPLTASTKTTFELLKKDFSIEQIAQMRKLKISTIYDHIVELALNIESFDISPYVDNTKEQLILAASKKSLSKQLKQIRQYVPEADYFEIRLVMAKHGDET